MRFPQEFLIHFHGTLAILKTHVQNPRFAILYSWNIVVRPRGFVMFFISSASRSWATSCVNNALPPVLKFHKVSFIERLVNAGVAVCVKGASDLLTTMIRDFIVRPVVDFPHWQAPSLCRLSSVAHCFFARDGYLTRRSTEWVNGNVETLLGFGGMWQLMVIYMFCHADGIWALYSVRSQKYFPRVGTRREINLIINLRTYNFYKNYKL